MADKGRFSWVDNWKGQLIFLAVFAHVLGGTVRLMSGPFQGVFDRIWLVIYAFHMPAFFCIAGMLWRSRPSESFLSFFSRKAKRLLVPYLVFGVLSAAIYVFLSGTFVHTASSAQTMQYYSKMGYELPWMPFASVITCGGWPFPYGMRMNSALWFLPSMIANLSAFWFLERYVRPTKLVYLSIAVVCFILSEPLFRLSWWKMLPLQIGTIVKYLPYLIIGRLGMPVERECGLQGWRQWGILAISALWLYLIYMMIPNWIWHHPRSYGWHLISCAAGVGGVYASYFIARIFNIGIFKVLGLGSLGILVMHKFPILGIQFMMPQFKKLVASGPVLALLGTLAVSVVAIAFCMIGLHIFRALAPVCVGEKNKYGDKSLLIERVKNEDDRTV